MTSSAIAQYLFVVGFAVAEIGDVDAVVEVEVAVLQVATVVQSEVQVVSWAQVQVEVRKLGPGVEEAC